MASEDLKLRARLRAFYAKRKRIQSCNRKLPDGVESVGDVLKCIFGRLARGSIRSKDDGS